MKFCTLFSGSSGNCIYIESGGAKFLLDAGKNTKTIATALAGIGVDLKEIDALFLTHEHSDHISAIPVLAGRYGMPIYGRRGTLDGVVEKSMLMPDRFTALEGDVFRIAGVEVRPFKTPHDTPDSAGYVFTGEDGKRLAVATDIGEFNSDVEGGLTGADFVVIESNHDVEMLTYGPYPPQLKRRVLSKLGHLSNDDCAKAVLRLTRSGVEHFVLAHLSGVNNTERHAMNATCLALMEQGIKPGDVTVDIAPRDAAGRLIEF